MTCTLSTLSGIRSAHLFRFFSPGSSKVCSGTEGCRIGKAGRATSLRIYYRKTHASANVDGRTEHEEVSIQRRADQLRKNRQGSVSPEILEIRLVGLVLLWIPANTRFQLDFSGYSCPMEHEMQCGRTQWAIRSFAMHSFVIFYLYTSIIAHSVVFRVDFVSGSGSG